MSIVLEDNIFSNSADNGGGGGGVEEKAKGDMFLKTDTSFSYSEFNYIKYRVAIDDKNILNGTYTYYGSGINSVEIRDSYLQNNTRKSYVELSFGQNQSDSYRDYHSCFALSPNKDLLVISGINSNTNIYAIPLTKSGDNYSLGTVASYDTGASAPKKCFVLNSTTFVNFSGTSAFVYSYQNGAITVSKTITLSSTPTKIKAYGENLVVLYSSKIEIINISTEEVVYTYTLPSGSFSDYILLYKNFGVFVRSNSPYYVVLDLEQNAEVNMSVTVDNISLGSVFSDIDNDFCEIDNNSIAISRSFSSSTLEYKVTKIDFSKKEITNIGTGYIPNNPQSGVIPLSVFYYAPNTLTLGTTYQGSSSLYLYDLLSNVVTQLDYKGCSYKIVGLAEE